MNLSLPEAVSSRDRRFVFPPQARSRRPRVPVEIIIGPVYLLLKVKGVLCLVRLLERLARLLKKRSELGQCLRFLSRGDRLLIKALQCGLCAEVGRKGRGRDRRDQREKGEHPAHHLLDESLVDAASSQRHSRSVRGTHAALTHY